MTTVSGGKYDKEIGVLIANIANRNKEIQMLCQENIIDMKKLMKAPNDGAKEADDTGCCTSSSALSDPLHYLCKAVEMAEGSKQLTGSFHGGGMVGTLKNDCGEPTVGSSSTICTQNNNIEPGLTSATSEVHRRRYLVKTPFLASVVYQYPSLGEEQLVIASYVFNHNGNESEFLVRKHNCVLTRLDLRTLCTRRFVSSQVVNLYCEDVNTHQLDEFTRIPRYCFQSHLMNGLASFRHNPGPCDLHQAINMWYDASRYNLKPEDSEMFLCPFAVFGVWSVVVVNLKHKRIEYLCSMASPDFLSHIHLLITRLMTGMASMLGSPKVLQYPVIECNVPRRHSPYITGVLAMKYLQCWDGSSTDLILPEMCNYYRVEKVHEMVMHPGNELSISVLDCARKSMQEYTIL